MSGEATVWRERLRESLAKQGEIPDDKAMTVAELSLEEFMATLPSKRVKAPRASSYRPRHRVNRPSRLMRQLEAEQKGKRRKKSKHRGRLSCNAIDGIAIFAVDPCSYCGETATTHDHIEPLSKGGAHELLNLTRCCVRCNFEKNTQKLIIFLAKRRAQRHD